ncbi:MAG: DUF488 domain-containing protein [Deltaproteobacteria bacterium]|nr:DUF488 domain-containing protein [Deltaproteobacteria bacterium]
MHELYTIGHSTHAIERFLELLKMHGITAVCDVRSHPYSRYNPQFNREPFREVLKKHGVSYVFLGAELGPRSDDPNCYRDGKIQYHLLSGTDIFQEGLRRLKKGMTIYRVALMCAEKDPIVCHRTILVCRHLRSDNIRIMHIMEDGSIEENDDAIRRLMRHLGIQEMNLFESPEEVIERAYDTQGEKIAYGEKDAENGS